jgi:hypothetical protein
MTDVQFGRLQDLPLRDAWKHEALSFTPWLAQNIDHIAEAIGIPLELTGQEVPVESFAADILARNPQDGSLVLIENQLEATDHTHLGQIMTYLAGLEARTVVWIAPTFREPHLSAIRWLNQHTADDFSFFAVRLRVVRIGQSPFAPIFEVVEKPNDWDRRLIETKRGTAAGKSALGDAREAYWKAYVARHPGTPIRASRLSYWSVSPESYPDASVSIWIGQKEGGIFVRGPYGGDFHEFVEKTRPIAENLEDRLGVPFSGRSSLFPQSRPGSLNDPASWPDLMDWQEEQLQRYLSAFNEVAAAHPREPEGQLPETL